MTLSDFQKLQEVKGWRRFYFLSENQPDYACAEPLKVNLVFHKMAVMTPYYMDKICLGEGDNFMWLDFVSAVDCEPHVLGDLLRIVCKSGKEFIIVAQ